jgi:hypothetical protein
MTADGVNHPGDMTDPPDGEKKEFAPEDFTSIEDIRPRSPPAQTPADA